MLVIFNPLAEPIVRTIQVNVYYTGISDMASIRDRNGMESKLQVKRDYTIDIPVDVPALGMSWYVLE